MKIKLPIKAEGIEILHLVRPCSLTLACPLFGALFGRSLSAHSGYSQHKSVLLNKAENQLSAAK